MSIARTLDHVAVAARALAPLAATYAGLGFTLTPVARHRGKATANRCIMLQDGYVELIALHDPAIPDRLEAQLARYAGLHIIALGIDDTAAALARLDAAGIPAAMAPLERPVDEADPASPLARFERIPLAEAPEGTIQLIKHLTPEAIWQPRFMAHANGAVALQAVVIASAAPADTAARLAQLAGVPLTPDPAGGFALLLDRGQLRIVTPEAVESIFPGVQAPALPAIVGMVIGTSDRCAALRPLLHGVPHQAVGEAILLPPGSAAGAAVLFT